MASLILLFSFFLNFLVLFSYVLLCHYCFILFFILYFLFLFFKQANSAPRSSAASPWFFHIFLFLLASFIMSYFFYFHFFYFLFSFSNLVAPCSLIFFYHLVLNIDINIKYLNILISFFKLGQLSISELCRWPRFLLEPGFVRREPVASIFFISFKYWY